MAAATTVSPSALMSKPTVSTAEEAFKRMLREEALVRVLTEHPRDDNPKQPSELQCALLSAFQMEGVLPRLATMSKKDWVEWMEPFVHFFFKDNGELFSEMMMRATLLVDLVVEHEETEDVVFMDGHGRFTWCFLKVLCDRGLLDSYRIQIVDIDKTVYRFHKAFFPSGIHILDQDVFEMEHHSRFVYYLNFCGTKGMREDIVEFVRAQRATGAPLLLSYFTGRGADLGSMDYALGRLGRDKHAPRATFPTYAFSNQITAERRAIREARKRERERKRMEMIAQMLAIEAAVESGDVRRSKRVGRGTKRGRG